MGSQSSKLVNENLQKQDLPIDYLNSRGSLNAKSGQSIKMQDNKSNVAKEIVNTTFKWNFGGQRVQVTGTFNTWKNPISLQKDKGGEFSILLPLPKGVHHYKFIVDGEWRFSPDDPTAPDEHGNINNIIDTSQQESSKPQFQKSPMNSIIQGDQSVDPSKSIFKNHTQPTINNQEMNLADQAPLAPPHNLRHYFIKVSNKQQNYLDQDKEAKLNKMWAEKIKLNGNQMEEEGVSKLSSQDAFDCLLQVFSNVNALQPPQHVCLNHLSFVNQGKPNKLYNVYSVTHRYKAKHTTIKFYAQKYPENKHQLFVI